jgi:GntP family gluconate:H+ symporter
MNPLWIVMIGVAVVVGGILLLRLHAFLALIAGAVIVALLTPASLIYRFSLRTGELTWTQSAGESAIHLKSKSAPAAGQLLVVLSRDATPTGYRTAAALIVTGWEKGGALAEVRLGDPAYTLHPGDIVVDPATEAAATSASRQTIGARIADRFGRTAANIGILIAMAAVLGQSLMESGAAERIVLGLRRAVGDERSALAFAISGFVLAALVLSDTTFYLLIPLAQVMRARTGKDYALYIMSLSAGAVMSHSLVPPAAGPLFVAGALNINIGAMILAGAIVGGIAAGSGYVYALWANRRWEIPLRGAVGVSEAELERISNRDESTLPPLWLSLTPIVLPVLLIAAQAIVGASDHASISRAQGLFGKSTVAVFLRILETLGETNMALTLAAAVGLLMVWSRRVPQEGGASPNAADRKKRASPVGQALASAGVMILIISAGGAFGQMVQQMDVAAEIKDLMPASKLALLPLAFVLTAAVRSAQGSAMVAMITATGIVSPIALAPGGLGYHPVYLAMAIGCGSKVFPWMNDAGFWIIGRMSGMTETETLKTVSVMMVIMGVVGLAATMVGAWLLPMAQ